MQLALDPVRVEPESKYPVIGVFGFGRGPIDRPSVSGSEISAGTLYRVRGGQFIYSRLKAFEGAYTVVPDTFDGRFASNEFPTFDIDESLAIPRYLSWLFREPRIWRDIASQSKGIGARRERVHPEQVLAFRAPLPPLEEQRRIVARLDRVAVLVERRRQESAAAEADMQALLSKAFARIVESAPHRPIAEVAPLVRRPVEIEPDGLYPELGVRSFGRGTFHKPVLRGSHLSWQKLFRIEKGDLVFSNIKAWEGAFAVAGAADHGRVGSHRYLTCVPNLQLGIANFLWFYLQTSAGLTAVQAASPGSADRNRTLGQAALESIKVPLPPLEIQHWFDRLQAKAREARAIRASTAQDVEALIPAMLHEIFSGRVEAA